MICPYKDAKCSGRNCFDFPCEYVQKLIQKSVYREAHKIEMRNMELVDKMITEGRLK